MRQVNAVMEVDEGLLPLRIEDFSRLSMESFNYLTTNVEDKIILTTGVNIGCNSYFVKGVNRQSQSRWKTSISNKHKSLHILWSIFH
jgi:hypothetical protein